MILNTMFLVTALLFSGNARAAEKTQTLLIATSDISSEVGELAVVLDDDGIATALQYSVPQKSETFPIQGLKNGIVFFRYSNLDVLKLQSEKFTPASGGPVTLTYLNNGLTRKYINVPVAIERMSTLWEFQIDEKSGRRRVSRAYLKANRVQGQIIGISTILFSSDEF